jgi:hypothetical protein
VTEPELKVILGVLKVQVTDTTLQLAILDQLTGLLAREMVGELILLVNESKFDAVVLGFQTTSVKAPVQTLMVIGVDELEVTLKVY